MDGVARDFMCSCTPEQLAQSEECLRRVTVELGAKPENLLSCIVRALQWGLGEDHFGEITGIYCDQWCAVHANVSTVGEVVIEVHVECDRVEHGLARVWELAKGAVSESPPAVVAFD